MLCYRKGIEHLPHQSTKPFSICGAKMRERCCPPDRSSAHFVCGHGGPVGVVMRSTRPRKMPSRTYAVGDLLRSRTSDFFGIFSSTHHSDINQSKSMLKIFYWPATCPGSATSGTNRPMSHSARVVSAMQSRFLNLHNETTHRRRPASYFPGSS